MLSPARQIYIMSKKWNLNGAKDQRKEMPVNAIVSMQKLIGVIYAAVFRLVPHQRADTGHTTQWCLALKPLEY